MSKKSDEPANGDPWKRPVEKVNRSASRAPSSGQYGAKSVKPPRNAKEQDEVTKNNDGNRHVVPNNERGGWDVVKENRERSSGHFETQKEAIGRAREIVEKSGRGNGEIVIHGKDGKIRDSDSGSRNESKAKDKK